MNIKAWCYLLTVLFGLLTLIGPSVPWSKYADVENVQGTQYDVVWNFGLVGGDLRQRKHNSEDKSEIVFSFLWKDSDCPSTFGNNNDLCDDCYNAGLGVQSLVVLGITIASFASIMQTKRGTSATTKLIVISLSFLSFAIAWIVWSADCQAKLADAWKSNYPNKSPITLALSWYFVIIGDMWLVAVLLLSKFTQCFRRGDDDFGYAEA